MYAKIEDSVIKDVRSHLRDGLENLSVEQLNEMGWVGVNMMNMPMNDPFMINNLEFAYVPEQNMVEAVFVPSPVELAKAKSLKETEIRTAWENAIKNGSFESVSIEGFLVDCRRNEIDNDVQNIDGMINLLTFNVINEPVPWKGVTEVKNLTLSQLMELKVEMLAYGAQVYQRKFAAFSALAVATTLEEVRGITF